MSFKPEVSTDDPGKFYGNGVRFPTQAEAEANASALADRWTSVRKTRVVESDDLPNYRWIDDCLVPMKPGEVA